MCASETSPGTRHRTAADQSRIADGVVRRAKGTHAHQSVARVQHTGHAVNLGGLQRLFKSQRRQNRRHAFGQHRLAAARRPDHQNVVSARAGHFHGALGRVLAAHILEVHRKMLDLFEQRLAVHHQRRGAFASVDESHHVQQALHRVNLDALDHRGLARVLLGHQQIRNLARPCRHGNGQRTTHRPQSAIERELSNDHILAELLLFSPPYAPRIPRAIGRSKPEPSFFKSAGARLMVM